MNNQEIIQKIQSVKLCLMAHPDNEQDSEFEDRISDLQEIEDSLGEQPIQSIEEASEQYASSNLGENPEDIARKWAKINFKAGAEWQAKQQPVREKTLQECKDEVARKYNYKNWKQLLFCQSVFNKVLKWLDEIAELYASSKSVGPQQAISIELLREYQSRLNEVYQNTGALNGIDVDYCLLLTLHDNGFEIARKPTTNK